MQLLITNQSDSIVEITDGKNTMYATTYKNGGISILCANASHRCWKGIGRTFWSWDEAVAGYKSAFMKAAIDLAREELAAA